VTTPPAPSSSGDLRQLDGTTQELAPGRYTYSGFSPGVTFTVQSGWSAQQFANGFFDIQQRVGTPDVIAVQFARVLAVTGASDQSVSTTSPEAAITALRRNERLRVSESSQTRVAGRAAIEVVVQTSDPVATDPPVFRSVLEVAAGPISIASARRLRVTLLQTPEGLLGILVGGSIAHWTETLALATPVVKSVSLS
jgi:hypothetical protein